MFIVKITIIERHVELSCFHVFSNIILLSADGFHFRLCQGSIKTVDIKWSALRMEQFLSENNFSWGKSPLENSSRSASERHSNNYFPFMETERDSQENNVFFQYPKENTGKCETIKPQIKASYKHKKGKERLYDFY